MTDIRKSDGQVVPEEISDGFHTMAELYAHRRALTALVAVMAALSEDSWRSKQHHPDDGPMFEGGWFIAGINLPTGTISYHYELKHWHDFDGVPELEHAPKWDGHTSADVLERIDGFRQGVAELVAEREEGNLHG